MQNSGGQIRYIMENMEVAYIGETNRPLRALHDPGTPFDGQKVPHFSAS